MKWPCPASEPTCLAPASGAAESPGHSAAKGCGCPASGSCQGQGGAGPAEIQLLGPGLPALSPAHHPLSGFSAYTDHRNYEPAQRIRCLLPRLIPASRKEPTPLLCPVHTPCRHRSHQFFPRLCSCRLWPRRCWRLEMGNHSRGSGRWPAGASLPGIRQMVASS